jgi:hypothetical protein
MTDPQPLVEGQSSWEWRWNRGLPGGCRCVYGQPTVARHPECPDHPSLDEIGYWDCTTITLHRACGL